MQKALAGWSGLFVYFQVYCFIDDLLAATRPAWAPAPDPRQHLSDAEVLTTALVAARYFGGNLACPALHAGPLGAAAAAQERLFAPPAPAQGRAGGVVCHLRPTAYYVHEDTFKEATGCSSTRRGAPTASGRTSRPAPFSFGTFATASKPASAASPTAFPNIFTPPPPLVSPSKSASLSLYTRWTGSDYNPQLGLATPTKNPAANTRFAAGSSVTEPPVGLEPTTL